MKTSVNNADEQVVKMPKFLLPRIYHLPLWRPSKGGSSLFFLFFFPFLILLSTFWHSLLDRKYYKKILWVFVLCLRSLLFFLYIRIIISWAPRISNLNLVLSLTIVFPFSICHSMFLSQLQGSKFSNLTTFPRS